MSAPEGVPGWRSRQSRVSSPVTAALSTACRYFFNSARGPLQARHPGVQLAEQLIDLGDDAFLLGTGKGQRVIGDLGEINSRPITSSLTGGRGTETEIT